MAVKAYIALGSNLANPIQMVQNAIAALSQLPQTQLLQQSSLYKTKPLGPQNQPDFINAVVLITTNLMALELLAQTQSVQTRLGRTPGERWGARVIDLDILLYGDEAINSDKLTIPHPGLCQREFVLYPLAEIAPDLILPTGQSILKLKTSCNPRGITLVTERFINETNSDLSRHF
jgi:2-amino-4-hydroxy-6-hydroxymethyldihydropteridine diphosphokinase